MPRRASYTTAFKLKVLKYAEKYGNRGAASHFRIDESNVRLWKRTQAQLEKMPKSKKSNRGGGICFPELDKKMKEWVSECRSKGYALKSMEIRLKACMFAQDLKLTDFKASSNWCYRFMARNNIATSFTRRKVENPTYPTSEDCDNELELVPTNVIKVEPEMPIMVEIGSEMMCDDSKTNTIDY